MTGASSGIGATFESLVDEPRRKSRSLRQKTVHEDGSAGPRSLAGARIVQGSTTFTERVAGWSKLDWCELWNGSRIIGAPGLRYRLEMEV